MLRKISKLMIVLSMVCGTTIFAGTPDVGEKNSKENMAQKNTIYPVAIFAFAERGSGVTGQGAMVADLLFANLINQSNIMLVERDEMKKMIDEAELNLSGMVNPNEAIKIGQLTGAKIIITGSVFKQKSNTYLVAKVIGTETSRVLGKSVNGMEGIDKLAKQLSEEVAKLITTKGQKLVAKVETKKDIIENIRKVIKDKEKPKVYISVTEKHIGQSTIDPAAENELQSICKELGFAVTKNEVDADIVIKGEGFSEFVTRNNNLICVKARLELTATDKKGNVLAVDSQTSVEVGLAEQITGKKALQEATDKLAERILPNICK